MGGLQKGVRYDSALMDIEQGDGHNYFGILEADDLMHAHMKEAISKEYLRRIRKILKSRLISGNVVSAIDARAVSITSYGAGISIGKQAR